MEDVITVAANLSTKGFEKGSKALKSAVSSLSRAAQSFGRTTQRGANTAISSFKRLIPTLIGVGSAYGILSKAVSSFMSQNEQLSSKMNSIWTALGNVLAPILTQIINWVTTAVSYFLEFLRLLGLTGKTASQLSQKANKSASQLQKTIAGFDELNVLQDNSGGGGANGHLDDVDPSAWMKKLADLLKNKMWDEAADMVIAKLNEFIYAFRDKAEEWGRIAGEWLQGITHFVARILDETDWKQLGVGIANFLNGLLAQVDDLNFGEDLGKIIAAKFTIAFKIVAGFLETFKFDRLGYIMSEMVKSIFNSMSRAIDEANPALIGRNIAKFFNNIDWTGIARSISGFLMNAWDFAFNALHNLLINIHWKDIGSGIRKFFEGLDPKEIADGIYTILKDAWDAAIQLLWGLLAGESDEKPAVIKALENLKQACEDLVGSAGEALSPVIEKLKEIFGITINEILPEIINDIAKAIEDLSKILSGDMKFGEFITHMNGLETVLLAIAGIKLGGLIGSLGTLVSTIGGNVMAALIGTGGLKGGLETAGTALGGLGRGLTREGGLVGALENAATKLFDFGGSLMDVEGPAGTFGKAIASFGTGLSDFAVGLGVVIEGLGVGGLLGVLGTVAAGIYAIVERIGDLSKTGMAEANLSTEEYIENAKVMNEQLQKAKENFDTAAQYTENLAMEQDTLDLATVGYNNALEQLAGSMGMTLKQLKEQLDAYDGNLDKLIDLKNSNDELIVTMSNEGKTIQEIADALGISTQYVSEQIDKNVELANATAETAHSGDELVDTTKEMADTAKTAETASKDLSGQTEQTGKKFGELEKAVSTSSEHMRNDFEQGLTEMGQVASEQTQDMNNVFAMNFEIIASNAFWWGQDLIINFNNGLVNAVNNVLEPTLENIAQAIKNYIGFSEPKKGPLSNFHTFAPDMMELFASGINKESGKVMKAVSAVAEGVADRFSEGDFKIAPNLSALNALSENIPFQMPAVAGGGILPYSLDSVNGAAGASEGNAEIMGAVTQLFERLDRLQRTFEEMQFVAEFEGWRAIATRVRQEEKKMDRAGGR